MQKVLGYDALETGLAMLPGGGGHRRGVARRVGPAQRPLRRARRPAGRAGADRRWLALLTRAPVDADYVTDLLPVMLLLGAVSGWPCRR